MNGLTRDLTTAFSNKEYRHAYAADFLNSFIAAQIRALRGHRDWTQADLADNAGMKQSRISVMENVNYAGWKVSTLAKLAEAFDVTLEVRFKSFGQRINDFDQFSVEALRVPAFEQDPVFHRAVAELEVPVTVPSQALEIPPSETREAAITPLAMLMAGDAKRTVFDVMAGSGSMARAVTAPSGQREPAVMAA